MSNVSMVLRATISFVIGLIIVAAICPLLAQQTTAAEAITDPESYRVYGAVVFSAYPALRGSVVMGEKTILESCRIGAGAPNADWLPVWEGFDRENARVRRLVANQPLGRPYRLATRAELDAIQQHLFLRLLDVVASWWRGGMLAVSAVGFDSTRTRARVFVRHHQCASGCGCSGQELLLVKRGGHWQKAGGVEVGASSPMCMVAY